jgi:hypothetical protein
MGFFKDERRFVVLHLVESVILPPCNLSYLFYGIYCGMCG